MNDLAIGIVLLILLTIGAPICLFCLTKEKRFKRKEVKKAKLALAKATDSRTY